MRAVDPVPLVPDVPEEEREATINDAQIIGWRDIHNIQGDLFRAEDQVEVVVTVNAHIPKVLLRATRAEAQQVSRGTNCLTATNRVGGRDRIPLAAGEYTTAE